MATKTRNQIRDIPNDPTIAPSFWFVEFHEATQKGDARKAAEAQLHLKAFGYKVSVERKRGEA